MISEEVIVARMRKMRPSVLAALLRVGRKIEQGFEGEIQLNVKAGGVGYIRWIQTETGEVIKEELG